MIQIIGFIIILVAIFFLTRQLAKHFLDAGEDEIANIFKDVEKKVLNIGKSTIEKEAGRLQRFADEEAPELIENILSNGLKEVLGQLPSQKNKSADKINGIYIISDDDDHPFQVTEAISELSKKICKDKSSDKEKARAIFDWFLQSIKYGDKKRGNVGYRTSVEVLETKEGVCGEMAILYVVMARSVGLRANYVSVRVDNNGKDVHHACAGVVLSGGCTLVDPAYFTFDIKHKKIKSLSDKDAVPHIKSFRKRR